MAKINDHSIEKVAIKGWNKIRQGIPLNSASKFNIGSCGKSFTALLAATFVEEGSLSWETKISDVFSDMLIHKDFNDITLRQLLSHTAGIRHFWSDEDVFEVDEVIPGLQGSAVQKRWIFTEWNLSQKPYFETGTHQYSNAGYVIVAAILEKISGKSFEQLMQDRVFNPLNLKSAAFGYAYLRDATQPHRHMRRYVGGMGIELNSDSRILDNLFNPSGNISLTIEDFSKYVIFYIKALKGEETRIDYHLVQDLFKPVVETDKGNQVGMGWQIIYIDGVKTYGHTGADGTSRSAMAIDPATNKAVVFATNIGDDQAELALINVVIELLGI
jgi:CubicO group peptidase (beta-lactamase class C family)